MKKRLEVLLDDLTLLPVVCDSSVPPARPNVDVCCHELAKGEGVKGVDRRRLRWADCPSNLSAETRGGSTCEREAENLLRRRNAIVDERGNEFDQRARLAGARACKEARVSVAVICRGSLLREQPGDW